LPSRKHRSERAQTDNHVPPKEDKFVESPQKSLDLNQAVSELAKAVASEVVNAMNDEDLGIFQPANRTESVQTESMEPSVGAVDSQGYKSVQDSKFAFLTQSSMPRNLWKSEPSRTK
jgi:hypothetical protein